MASIKLKDLEVSQLSFEEVKMKNGILRLPRIDDKDIPNIILPRIYLNTHGVPKLGKYFKSDKDRMFLQLPLDGDVLKLFDLIDCCLSTNEMKQKLFKEPGNTYEYSPIVKQGMRGPYMKVKLECDYETGDIETVVWQSHKIYDGTIQTNDSPLEIDDLDDFASAFPIGSSVVCAIRFVKLWCVDKKYGLTMKLVKANVLAPEKKVMDCSDLDFDF